MKKCIEKLKVVEANRAAVVSELKEALQEQESELEKVRTQLQLAEAMVHEASNMQRRLKNEPTIPLAHAASSAEPGKALPNGQAKEQQKTAAAILADKIAASSNSQQILQSALSKFAAEEAKNSSETRSASDKRQKTDQTLQVPSVANAAAFVPMPQVVATTAQQQPQAMLVQQAPMQSQAPAPHPQYNIYQAPPQQFVQQPGGVMMGMPYNMSTMTPPPPPPPTQMMNLGRPSLTAPQPQMGIMPQTQPPAPPMLQQQMPMSLAPQMQFALQQPGVPPFRPMQPPPPGMQYFHPQSQ
jgi:regulator of Ty1 transposition protein 103